MQQRLCDNLFKVCAHFIAHVCGKWKYQAYPYPVQLRSMIHATCTERNPVDLFYSLSIMNTKNQDLLILAYKMKTYSQPCVPEAMFCFN